MFWYILFYLETASINFYVCVFLLCNCCPFQTLSQMVLGVVELSTQVSGT